MSTLPKAVEELSFETIKTRKVTKLKQIIPTIANQLVDSDPAIALLEIASYSEGLLRNRINNCVLAVMLDYAVGSDLDNLGKLFAIERKLIQEEDTSSIPPKEAIYESDDELRQRIKEAPRGLSVAGPKSAYIYYGKLADSKVKDISATSPEPMEVNIAVLSYEGRGEASEELIKKVAEQLGSESIRPMGDKVEVKGAEIIEFRVEINIVYKTGVLIDEEQLLNEIKNNVAEYVEEQHKLGGFITLAGLNACSFRDEVLDVVITSPLESIKCSINQAPYCGSIEITGGGSE